MTRPDSDEAPGKFKKMLFELGYHPWMRLYGSRDNRWRLKRPIFMVGCPRSGTGLAVRMFALHPDVANLSEAGDLWDPVRYNDPDADHDWKAKDVTEEATKRMHSRFEFWRRLQGAERFVNKHPRNTVRFDYLRTMFPDAVFIHVVRDGRAVVNSIVSRIQREPHRLKLPFWNFCKPPNWREFLRDDPVEQAAFQWREIVRFAMEKGKELGAAYHQFRYEDLCEQPRKITGAAWRFAGLRVDDSIARRIPEKLHSQDFKWKRSLTTEQIRLVNDIQGPLLSELGYDV